MVGGAAVDMCQGGEGHQQILWHHRCHGEEEWQRPSIDSKKKHKQCVGKDSDGLAEGAPVHGVNVRLVHGDEAQQSPGMAPQDHGTKSAPNGNVRGHIDQIFQNLNISDSTH